MAPASNDGQTQTQAASVDDAETKPAAAHTPAPASVVALDVAPDAAAASTPGAAAAAATPGSAAPATAGEGKGEGKGELRRGKWTTEEEAYVKKSIDDFNSGMLPVAAGTTLRSYLSEKLNCDPM